MLNVQVFAQFTLYNSSSADKRVQNHQNNVKLSRYPDTRTTLSQVDCDSGVMHWPNVEHMIQAHIFVIV